jgi:hypothetical protein
MGGSIWGASGWADSTTNYEFGQNRLKTNAYDDLRTPPKTMPKTHDRKNSFG